MSTYRPKKERSSWYLNKDGCLETTKRSDEILSDSYDFTNELASGETVSSAAWDQDGPTISGTAVASPVVTWTITGSGYATLKATLSTGRLLHRRLHWLATDETPADYS